MSFDYTDDKRFMDEMMQQLSASDEIVLKEKLALRQNLLDGIISPEEWVVALSKLKSVVEDAQPLGDTQGAKYKVSRKVSGGTPENAKENKFPIPEQWKDKDMQKDQGKHYRHTLTIPLTQLDKVNGYITLSIDPALIERAYPMNGMRFTMLKKVLRCGTGNKTYREDLLDIISAAQREVVLLDTIDSFNIKQTTQTNVNAD